VTELLESQETDPPTPPAAPQEPPPAPAPGRWRPELQTRRLALAAGAAVVLVVLILAVALSGGSGVQPPATGAAGVVPADALAYVNVSLDRGRPAVRQALSLAERFPDFPLASAAVQTRLGAILAGGRSVDFAGQIEPWLGNEAALALLNTPTSTAGSLIVLDVKDSGRAQAFIHSQGAVRHGSYGGTTLFAYPTGTELAFVSHFLVLGQDASVRSAIDVAAGKTPSLRSSPVYQRAAGAEPSGRVLDAYASLAGVRRVLAPQGGLVGALGDLLYQPALQGVTVSLTPATGGARIDVHSALDPTLTHLSAPATTAFAPTLQNVMPTGAILMLDVTGLDRVAPQVLNAGSVAGVAGGIGPLLSRLGSALSAEGVNVHSITSIFHAETAVAIVPHAQSPTLVIVARTAHPAQVRTELAQLEIPLAQLFKPPSSGPGKVPEFTDRSVAGITDHQLSLANGLELDYAVFRGLVVISTSIGGVEAVAERTHPLAQDPGFQFTLGSRPGAVTSLVYLDFRRLLALGEQTGLSSSATFRKLRGDLETISSAGLSSTRSAGESSAQLSIRIP
jgi:hypothetical protein